MRVLPDVLFLLFDMIHLNLTQDKNNFAVFSPQHSIRKCWGKHFYIT